MAEFYPTTSADASIGTTLKRAVDLAQRVATDEVRLLQLESRDRIEALLRRGGWVAAGVLCLVLAWMSAAAAAVVALETYLSLPARLGLLAASQGLLGAGLLAWGVRERSGERA